MQENNSLLLASQKDLRSLNWKVLISFEKQFDDNITFFTLDTSLLDSPDFLQGTNNVVQEWDKYEYVDYTDRVIDISVEREDDRPSSVSLGMADIRLNNYDDFFDPLSGSSVSSFVLPGRPIRILMGFENELVPVFVGLSEKMPIIDDINKVVSFHCVDFLSYILSKPLDEETILVNATVDECLEQLFTSVGLLPGQYILDVSSVVIPFFYAKKGEKLFDVVSRLVEIEIGRLFMDENGVICFEKRNTPVGDIDIKFNSSESINSSRVRRETDLINVVEVRSDVRTVQANQKFWEASAVLEFQGGESKEIWADFTDPVVSVDVPSGGGATSFFVGNSQDDGGGTDLTSSLSLSEDDQFSTSYRMVIKNSSSNIVYLTSLVLFAEPALVTSNVYVREEDPVSVEKYGEKIYSFQNDYFASESDASSFALSVLSDYSAYSGLQELEVKGTPQIQLGDLIESNIFDKIRLSKVTRIEQNMGLGSGFFQRLRVKDYVVRTYFTLGESVLDGEDQLAP